MAYSEKIMNACLDGFNNLAFKPRGGHTYCNQFVSSVAIALGFHGFVDRTANEMIKLMRSSGDWERMKIEYAGQHARFGLVIAGLTKPKNGHIAVVLEGKTAYSGKWKVSCPLVANVGRIRKDNKWYHIETANHSFINMPYFWKWQGEEEA